MTAELAEPEPVGSAARTCLGGSAGGQADILVNNAAWQAAGVSAEDESYEEIRRALALNIEAPVLLAPAAVPGMRAAGRGTIISITSITAPAGIGRYPQAAYAATKGGPEALTREWAAQWGRHGIRVNTLAPGVFETEFTAGRIREPVCHATGSRVISLSLGTASRRTSTGRSCCSPATLAGTSPASA